MENLAFLQNFVYFMYDEHWKPFISDNKKGEQKSDARHYYNEAGHYGFSKCFLFFVGARLGVFLSHGGV